MRKEMRSQVRSEGIGDPDEDLSFSLNKMGGL